MNDIVADPGLRKPIDEFPQGPKVRIVLILFFLLVILIIEEVYDICKLCSIEGGGSSRIGSSGANS